MNPYEPATELDDAIVLEQPRKTTKAFRRTMWGLGVLLAVYIGGRVGIDFLRSRYILQHFFQDNLYGRAIYDFFAW